MNRRIYLGWTAPAIEEQVPELSAADAARIEGHRAAITRLYVHDFISESQKNDYYSMLKREILNLIAPPSDKGGTHGR